jgi:hypothetical protein
LIHECNRDNAIKHALDEEAERHTPEQIIRKLRDAVTMLAVGKKVENVYQVLEYSEATYHRRQNQYGGMKGEEAKRLKELDQENKRLKKLLAEAKFVTAVLEEALEGNL